MRKGAAARTVDLLVGAPSMRGVCTRRPAAASGDEADEASTLLLGEATPHPVALPVLQGPREAHLADAAGAAVSECRPGLLLRGREEHIGVDAVAGRLVLPRVGRSGARGE